MAKHTEMSLQRRAELLFKRIQRIQGLVQDTTNNFIAIGKYLYSIQKGKYYLAFGDHIKTFEDFLSEDILPFKRTTAFNLIKIYKVWGKEKSDKLDIGYERLVRLLPFVTENNKMDLVRQSRGHREHFENFIRELKQLPLPDKCDHEQYKDRYIYFVKCPNCSKTWRIKRPKKL